MSEDPGPGENTPRVRMSAATRFALAAAGLILLVPLFGFISVAGHGFGPCGPANFAGFLECFGFLVCIPGSIILAITALTLWGREQRKTAQTQASGPRERTNWLLMAGVLAIPLLLIGLSILIGQFARR